MPILLLLLLLLTPGLAHAQGVNEGTTYRSDYAAYIKAKNQHIQYNTGSTRLEAISKTDQVLESRNTWEIAYLKYLRQTLADATNIANYPQTVAFLDLETQVTNLAGLSGSFSGLDSATKINTASAAWEANLPKIDVLVSAAQVQIASARLASLQDSFVAVGTPSGANQSTLDLINSKYASSVATRKKVDQQINGFKSNGFSRGSLLVMLNQAKSDLVEAAKLLLELSFQSKQ